MPNGEVTSGFGSLVFAFAIVVRLEMLEAAELRLLQLLVLIEPKWFWRQLEVSRGQLGVKDNMMTN